MIAELLHLRAAKYGGWIHHKKNTIRPGHWFHLATQAPVLVMTFPMRVGDLKSTRIPIWVSEFIFDCHMRWLAAEV